MLQWFSDSECFTACVRMFRRTVWGQPLDCCWCNFVTFHDMMGDWSPILLHCIKLQFVHFPLITVADRESLQDNFQEPKGPSETLTSSLKSRYHIQMQSSTNHLKRLLVFQHHHFLWALPTHCIIKSVDKSQ